MAAPLSVSIVHPGYSNLKKFSPLLHFLAGLVFIAGAYNEFITDNRLTAFCEVVIGLDVIALAFMKHFAEESPHTNAGFRLIETIVFAGLVTLAILDQSYITAVLLLIATVMYAYVFHCEKKLIQREKVSVHHLGVTISDFPKDKHIDWEDISALEALPHSITITTRKQKIHRFDFPKAIAFGELEQIHEFCNHYLT